MPTTTTNQAEQARDAAIEQFNDDMSNACGSFDRLLAEAKLSERIGSATEAHQLSRDWMVQQRQAAREFRA